MNQIGDLDALTGKPLTGEAVGYARVSLRLRKGGGGLDRQSGLAAALPQRRVWSSVINTGQADDNERESDDAS